MAKTSKAKPGPSDPPATSDHACTKSDASKPYKTYQTVVKHPWPNALLKHLRADPSMTRACLVAGITRPHVYAVMAKHGRFARAVKKAIAQGRKVRMQEAEDELYRRAVKGWKESVYQGGIKVGTKDKYSDALLTKFVECNSKRYAKRSESTVTSVSVAFTVDARQRLLSDPLARELACALAEQLAQPKAVEATVLVSLPCEDRPCEGESGQDPA